MSAWKDTLVGRFDRAAATYDGAAGIQRRIAEALAAQVLDLPLAAAPEVLEIGCGTGFLAAALGPGLPGSRWLATDLAPRMLEACARRLGPGVGLRVMDGECPDLGERRFDLVVSSLAVQWFADPAAGIRRLHRLLKPGGVLAVTTLGAGTFAEWRAVCEAAGMAAGTPSYPTAEALGLALGPGPRIRQGAWPMRCGGLKAFLDHLRLTGARTAAPERPPAAPAALGRLLRSWGAAPFCATYDVLTVIWRAS